MVAILLQIAAEALWQAPWNYGMTNGGMGTIAGMGNEGSLTAAGAIGEGARCAGC